MSEVTGDSYVYFIGDARNNKNASGEDYVKAIARKAKKAFWLNTEPADKWNHGDSIMGTYSKYMTKIAQTANPAELLGFLDEKSERTSVLQTLKEKCDTPECNPTVCRKVRAEHEL